MRRCGSYPKQEKFSQRKVVQKMYRNSEGYPAPTEGMALARMIREEKKKASYEARKQQKYVLAWHSADYQPNLNKERKRL